MLREITTAVAAPDAELDEATWPELHESPPVKFGGDSHPHPQPLAIVPARFKG